MDRFLGALVALLVTGLPAETHAADPLPKAALYLDEFSAAVFRPGSSEIARAFRDNLSSPTAMYVENLGLNHFGGQKYETLLHNYLQEKYELRPIGLFVAMGPSALQFALRLRSTSRWAEVPIVFGAIDSEVAAQIMSGAA